MGITRQDYQANRLRLLSRLANVEQLAGLEIGACDLPTVPQELGRCEFADFRTADEMVRLWALAPETVVPVNYVLRRDQKVHQQILQTFDYVVLCHVIEHVPNVVGYINDLRRLLNPGGVIFIACPDKRRTFDAPRPSTTLEHLLDDAYRDASYPSLEHILEFGRAATEDGWRKWEESAAAFFEWGKNAYESGNADVHCHVWTDREFFDQLRRLIDGAIIAGLEMVCTSPNEGEFNEFHVALRATEGASAGHATVDLNAAAHAEALGN